MKKRSFSLGEGGIKQLFAEHVEKVIFVGFILVGLSLIYFAFKHKSLSDDMVPSRLIGEAKKARDFIHVETWKENAERFPVNLKVVEEVEGGMGVTIDGKSYVTGEPTITKAERVQLNKRTDPALLAAFDLQAKGMFGTIPWKVSKGMTKLNDLEYGSLRTTNPDGRPKDEEESKDGAPAIGFGVRPEPAKPGGNSVLTRIPQPIEREMDGVRAKGSAAANVGIPGGYIVGVTALVPFRQQIIEFQVLKGTEGANLLVDYPWYAKLEVERMDLDDAKPHFVDITDRVNMWSDNSATRYPEVCDPDHYDPKIALKILPFLRSDPTRLALHPLIPAKKWIAAEAKVEESEREEDIAQPFDVITKPDDDVKNPIGAPGNIMPPQMPGTGMATGAGTTTAEKMADLVLEPEDAPEFKLVRFFDVITAPGKRYQYRVRLRLYDPNLPSSIVQRSSGIASADRGGGMTSGGGMSQPDAIEISHGNKRVNESMLDDAVRKRLRDLVVSEDFASRDENVRFGTATPWSEPSNVITSPAKSENYFAGAATLDKEREAKGVKFYQSEPKAELAITVWDSFYMYDLPGFAEVNRGSPLNLKQVVKLVHPIDLTIREIRGGIIKPYGRIKEDTYEGIELDSQAVVIDITGGVKLPNKTRSDTDFFTPSEVLVFDGESFSLQDELEDKRLFRENSLYEVEEEETSTSSGSPAGNSIFGFGN